MTKQELNRRRSILSSAIGDYLELKRDAQERDKRLRNRRGKLVEVRRTRATLDFGDIGEWNVSICLLLLPFSVEPLPGQRELFPLGEGGAA